MRGKFIVLDGLDGTGKSTQARLLAEKLEKNGEKVHLTAEPTRNGTGKFIREILSGKIPCESTALAALFLADRIEHNKNSQDGIQKLLNEGVNVVCDRYYYSSFAYQGNYETLPWVMALNLNCPDIIKPDICLLFDMEVDLCIERIYKGRKQDKLEIFENKKSLEEIRSRFFEVVNFLKGRDKIIYIDASKTQDEVENSIKNALKMHLSICLD